MGFRGNDNRGWFDEDFQKEYPVKVADELYTNEDRTKVAWINVFDRDDERYAVSNPHVEIGDDEYLFFYPFVGEDAEVARAFWEQYLCHPEKDGFSFRLMRREQGELFFYGFGDVAEFLLPHQETLQKLLPSRKPKDGLFLLPLRRRFGTCPLCGHRTEAVGLGEICSECGNEEGFFLEEEDVEEKRLAYLKAKRKNPIYRWDGTVKIEKYHEELDTYEYEKEAVIPVLIALGRRFVNLFDAIYRERNIQKSAHEMEIMQDILDNVLKITVLPQKRPLHLQEKMDSFFTVGESAKHLFQHVSKEAKAYSDFVDVVCFSGSVKGALAQTFY